MPEEKKKNIPPGKVIDKIHPTLMKPLKTKVRSQVTFKDLHVIATQLKEYKKDFPEEYKRKACFPCIKIRT